MPVIVTNDEETHVLPDLIVTHATDRNRELPEVEYRTHLLIYRVKNGLGPLPPFDQDHMKGRVAAFINGGRWVLGCDICHTAVVAEPLDPWFCCPGCGSGGKWRAVVFPTKGDKAAIEAILLLRPGFRHSAPSRNWDLGETKDDLRRQNIAKGDPVDQLPADLDYVEVLTLEPEDGDVALQSALLEMLNSIDEGED